MPSRLAPPHRTQVTGTGAPVNPARARCVTCGWESPAYHGPAGKARARLDSRAHQSCVVCTGSGHATDGTCPVCDGTGLRPA